MSTEWIAVLLTALGMLCAASVAVATWLWRRADQEARASVQLDAVLTEVRTRDAAREHEIAELTQTVKALADACQVQAISIAQLTERCGQALQACEHNQSQIDQLRTMMARRQPL